MEVSHCHSLQQLNVQLNRLIDPCSREWPNVTAKNIEEFINSNRKLIIENQASLAAPLHQLASRVERNFKDESAAKLADQIRSLSIFFPAEVLTMICEAGVRGTQLEKGLWLGSVARASCLFDSETVRLRVLLINQEKLPISINFGLETKEDVLKFVKQYGHALTYLKLDALAEKDIFKGLTSNELIEILRHCPQLKELSLNGFPQAIDGSIWQTVNSLSHLKHLSITFCEGIKFVADLTLPSLESLKFHGTINQIPETFPASLIEMDLMRPPGPDELFFTSDLPNQLKILKLNGFSAEIPPRLPETLREICLIQFYCNQFPERWPPFLEKLSLSGTSFQGAIPETPTTLVEFIIDWSQEITQIPAFSEKLKKLYVDNCQQIAEIRVLPPNVEEFYFFNEVHQITIPELTTKVKSLGLSPCQYAWQALIDRLPATVNNLDLLDSNLIDFSCALPNTIEILSLNMLQLERISSEFPPRLKQFDLIASAQFRHLERRFPETIQKLSLACGIVEHPYLPKSLVQYEITGCMAITDLNLVDMPNLVNVGCWNRSIKKVNVRNCPKLDLSSILSNPITHLTLHNLPQVRTITGLGRESLIELDINNCRNLKAGQFVKSFKRTPQ